MPRTFRILPAAICVLLGLPSAAVATSIFDSLQYIDTFDRNGVYAAVGAGGERKTGNVNVGSVSGSANLGYRVDDHILFFAAQGAYGQASGEVYTKYTLEHLRYRYYFASRWATESYVQHEQDPFRRISLRALAGAGLRYELPELSVLSVALGTSVLGERMIIEDDDASDSEGSGYTARNSSYVTLSVALSDVASAGLTGYAQPRLVEPSDVRYSANAFIESSATDWLSLEVFGSVAYDNTPAREVEKLDTSSGFKLTISIEPAD